MANHDATGKGYPPGWLSWSMWALGALFYLIGFFQRVTPAVMTGELMKDFGINAAALGNLSGFYFYAYVAMQIPTGILADSWGPRKLLTAGCLVAGLGAMIFAGSESFWWACVGRLLIGGSVAVAFVVLLKLTSHWLPPRLFAFASGLILLSGLTGAISAGMPLRILVDAFGWRAVTWASGFFTILAALAIWIFVRNDPSQRGYRSYAPENMDKPTVSGVGPALSGLVEIFKYRNTWLLFLAPAGMVGPVLAFSGLWGVPYLAARYDLEQATAAMVCSFMLITWGLGGPVVGWLSDRIKRRKLPYLTGSLVAGLTWVVIIYLPLPLPVFVAVLALNGLANGGMIVGFAFAKESVPPSLAGTVSGVVNMGVMIGPTVLQPTIGWVLDMFWQGGMLGGVRIYSLESFHKAFVLILAWSLFSFIAIALAKETGCRQVVKQ